MQLINKISSSSKEKTIVTQPAAEPWPSELRVNPRKDELRITFTGGRTAVFPAEFLRVLSPSAEVQGHSKADRRLVFGKRKVTIREIEPVGNYAVRITFADGHNTGIFSWAYFDELARNQDALWDGYLAELAAAGLTREK